MKAASTRMSENRVRALPAANWQHKVPLRTHLTHLVGHIRWRAVPCNAEQVLSPYSNGSGTSAHAGGRAWQTRQIISGACFGRQPKSAHQVVVLVWATSVKHISLENRALGSLGRVFSRSLSLSLSERHQVPHAFLTAASEARHPWGRLMPQRQVSFPAQDEGPGKSLFTAFFCIVCSGRLQALS